MEYYSSDGLKRAAKEKLAYQSGVAIGAYLVRAAILFGFFMMVVFALMGTLFQPMFNMLSNVDMATDPLTAQKQMQEQMIMIQDMMMKPQFMILSGLVSAIVGALAATLSTGYSHICLKISRSGTAKISDLFFVYRNNPDRVILLYLLIFIVQTIIGLPSDLVAYFASQNPGSGGLLLLNNILLIANYIVSYIFSLMVSQVFFLYLDDTQKPTLQVFSESMALMKGHKGRLFYLQISFIGWLILGVLTFGMLLIWVGPYMEATYAEFYRNLKKEPLYVATQGYSEETL